MVSGLPGIIIDVIELIASHLGPRDICSLRLTCRDLNHKSLHIFGKVCLNTFTTDLSEPSLQSLRQLANNNYLASHTRTLLIKGGRKDLGQGFQWHRHADGHLEGQQRCTQILQDLLFGNLCNCRAFIVHSIICDESLYKTNSVTPTDAVGILLSIVATAGLPVESFAIDFQSQGIGRMDGARLYMPQYWTTNFNKAWASLTELELEHSLTPQTSDGTLELLLRAKNLRKLSLNLGCNCPQSFLDRVVSAKSLSRLQELHLYSFIVTAAQMEGLLCQSKETLRIISLWFLSLGHDGDWGPVLKTVQSNSPRLENVSLFWLQGRSLPGKRNLSHAVFPNLPNNSCSQLSQDLTVTAKKYRGVKQNVGARYEGKDAGKALGAIADSIDFI